MTRLPHRQSDCASQQIQVAHVRFGSKADICSAPTHVRFTPNSDRKSRHTQTVMSALPPKADMCGALTDVRFGPKADMCAAIERSDLLRREFARSRTARLGEMLTYLSQTDLLNNLKIGSSSPACAGSDREHSLSAPRSRQEIKGGIR